MRHRFISFIIIFMLFAISGLMAKYKIMPLLYKTVIKNEYEDMNALAAENAALRNKLAAFATSSVNAVPNGIVAHIFASYPFNNQNAVVIDKGSNQGIRPHMPATIGGVVLMGYVTDVFANYSIVRTITSPDAQVPVRIGLHKVPGLLVGGPTPRITMIPNNKTIAINDSIIAASQDLPYGLAIGAVESFTADGSAGVFQEAAIALGYDMHSLTELTILVWTPR